MGDWFHVSLNPMRYWCVCINIIWHVNSRATRMWIVVMGPSQYQVVVLPEYEFHYKDKPVWYSSYLYNGNLITEKTIFIFETGSGRVSYNFLWKSSSITKTTNKNNAMYTENFYENVLKKAIGLTLRIPLLKRYWRGLSFETPGCH